MRKMPSSAVTMLYVFVLSLLAFTQISYAASSDSFCKCTCGSNSTIIPLNHRPSTGDVSYSDSMKGSSKTPSDDDENGITPRSFKRHPSRRSFNRRMAGPAHAHISRQREPRDQPAESYPDGYHDPVGVEKPYDADSTGDKGATGEEAMYESGNRKENEYESGSEEEKGGTLLGSSGGSSLEDAYDGSQRQKGVGIGTSCADCNRQFCLANNLPICQDVSEDDVTAVCFQRDSTKDQLVVYGFMFLTVGLFVYAGIRPWIQTRADTTINRGSYVAVSSGQGNN